MIKSLICLAGWIMLVPTDGKQLLTEVLNRYTRASGLEVAYTIESGTNKQADKCTYYTNGKDYYADTGERTSLLNDDYFIVVNKAMKQVLVSKRTKHKKGDGDQFSEIKNRLADSQVTTIKGKGFTGVKLRSEKTLIQEVLYEITDKEHTLKRVQYSYTPPNEKKPVTTTITYTKTVFDRDFDRDFFSEKRIVKKTGKGFEITHNDLKGYTIVDLTK